MRLLINYLIIAISVTVAAMLVPGITIGDNAWWSVLVMALVLGILNVFLRPVLQFASCGCIILTFGLFVFVVNGIVFWLASWISVNWFGLDFVVDGFWPAFWGGLIVSIVSTVLDWFAHRDEYARRA